MGPYTPAEKSQLKTISTDVISTADKEIALHYKLQIFVNIKKKTGNNPRPWVLS
jgi:hypothetical protein